MNRVTVDDSTFFVPTDQGRRDGGQGRATTAAAKVVEVGHLIFVRVQNGVTDVNKKWGSAAQTVSDQILRVRSQEVLKNGGRGRVGSGASCSEMDVSSEGSVTLEWSVTADCGVARGIVSSAQERVEGRDVADVAIRACASDADSGCVDESVRWNAQAETTSTCDFRPEKYILIF